MWIPLFDIALFAFFVTWHHDGTKDFCQNNQKIDYTDIAIRVADVFCVNKICASYYIMIQ